LSRLHKIALVLTIIGALNWGVAGFFKFDVVAEFAGGTMQPLARFIYIIIGIAGLINLGLLFDDWREREDVRIQAPEEV
jgi:uncharacterized membrane protein YuzA (DUF378 family)